jgi:hypothetical protein
MLTLDEDEESPSDAVLHSSWDRFDGLAKIHEPQ